MKTSQTVTIVALLAAAMLSGCTTYYPNDNVRQYPVYPQQSNYPVNNYPAQNYPQQQAYYAGTGVVESIQVVQVPSDGSGGGALAGGVIGGVLGNQVGRGGGRTVATAAGLIGGALLGNQIERNSTPPQQYYQVNIRLDHGGHQSFRMGNVGDLQPGVRVRVENNQIYRY
ncbi:MAG: glycine zipper 2TM domain-containing protein [Pseudomonadota bacterium]